MSLDGYAAWTFLPGSGHIQGTDDHLRFEPRTGAGGSLSMPVGDTTRVAVGVSNAELPSVLHVDNVRLRGRTVGVLPVSASLLTTLGSSDVVQPYIGAGVLYFFARHAEGIGAAPSLHVMRLESPDHPAVLVEAGVRVPIASRWSFVADAKYGPAPSTMETFTTEIPHDGLQTNFHPLILSSGIGVHF